MLQPLIDALFWLTLATWFGCVLTSAVLPPIILKTIRDADPTLPRVLSVNLDKQHSTLLAGSVVGAILAAMFRLQAICAGVFVLPLIGKIVMLVRFYLVDRDQTKLILSLIIGVLYLGATAFLLYGWRVVWPRVMKHRETYIANADDPDVANAELDAFDRYSHELGAIIRNVLFCLLGVLLFSAALPPVVLTYSN